MPAFTSITFALAFLLLAGMFIYDPSGTAYRLKRMVTFDGRLHMPVRKPKERLLSPPELAALEIECGIEPSWTPPPVASLVTRPGGVIPMPRAYLYDPAKDGPIIYLPPTARKGERR